MSDGLNYEIWTTVNSGDFKRVTDISKWVLPGSIVDLRFVDMSSGKLKVSLRCPDLDKILVVDPDDHTNDVGSTLMLFDNGTWIAALVPTRRRIAFADEKKPWVEYQLEGMEWYLDRARVKAFDYSADPIREGDWIYGAPTILTKAGGEISDAQWFLWITGATTGNYALTDGTDTTSDIAWNETDPSVIKTRLETDITAITTVAVSGQGTAANKFLLLLTDPAETDLTLTEATPSGAPHDGTLTIDQTRAGGSLSPRPWHGSIDGNTGVIIGNYAQFDMVLEGVGGAPSKPAGSASTHLLRLDGEAPDQAGDYPGVQQEAAVISGHRHRSSIQVYSATVQTFRLVIRTLTEGEIAADEVTVAAATWTTLSIPTFTTNEGVDTIVYRIGIITDVDPGVVYMDIDEAVLAPGAAAAPLGEIATDLLTPIIARSVLAWTVNTWTDPLDSSGAAWDQSLSQGLRKGQSIFHFLEYESRWGYERTLRYDPGNPASTPFDFGLYNPGNADNDPADTSVSAMDGMIKASPIEEAAPDFSTAVAEGAEGTWGEYTDAVLATGWGKLEGYFANKQGRDSVNLDVLAQQMVTDSATETVSHSASVQNPSNVFGVDFLLGDTLPVAVHAADGSIRAENLRLVGCTIKETKTLPIYDYSFGAIVFDPEAAQADAMRTLIRKFQALDSQGGTAGATDPIGFGVRASLSTPGAGTPTVVVAAADSSVLSRSRADFRCTGTDDQDTIETALAKLSTTHGGRLWLAEGTYNLSATINIPAGNMVHIEGAGWQAAQLKMATSGIDMMTLNDANTNLVVRDVQFNGNSNPGVGLLVSAAASVYVTHSQFFDINTTAIDLNAQFVNQVIDSLIQNAATGVIYRHSTSRGHVTGNDFENNMTDISVVNTAGTVVVANRSTGATTFLSRTAGTVHAWANDDGGAAYSGTITKAHNAEGLGDHAGAEVGSMKTGTGPDASDYWEIVEIDGGDSLIIRQWDNSAAAFLERIEIVGKGTGLTNPGDIIFYDLDGVEWFRLDESSDRVQFAIGRGKIDFAGGSSVLSSIEKVLSFGADITIQAESSGATSQDLRLEADDSGGVMRTRLWIDGDGDMVLYDDAGVEIARWDKSATRWVFAGTTGIVLPVKTTTGDPASPAEGQLYVNTFDNTVRVFADAAWRDLATW